MNEDNFGIGYALGRDSGGNYGNNGFGFGNGWEGLIGLALVAGLFGGWGNGGFGIGGGRGNYGGIAENYALATDFATIERKLDGVNNGLCDGFYAQNTNMLNGFAGVQNSLTQGFAGINATINNGFAGVNNAICTLGYQNQAGFNSLGHQISDCCCNIRTELLQNRFFNEKQTCDLITNANSNTQRIIDFMVNEKMSAKDARIASLEAQISNDRQSRYIVDALSPKCPQPAYVVQPPQEVTFPTNCCGNVAYANYNNGCGCGL